MLTGGRFGRIASDLSEKAVLDELRRRRPISATEFARRALLLIARNKVIIVIPASYNIGWWIYRLIPSWGLSLARKGHLQQIARTTPSSLSEL